MERETRAGEDEMAYHGLYRGIVTNSSDPIMKGRVQVNIPAVSAGGTWAAPCREYGSHSMPPVGTVVWVMFERGDVSYPVWMGCMS